MSLQLDFAHMKADIIIYNSTKPMGNSSVQRIADPQVSSNKFEGQLTDANKVKRTIQMDDSIMSHQPNLLAMGLQMYVINALTKNSPKQLTYYFPIGHGQNHALQSYNGKYASQADFQLFKDQMSCVVSEDGEKFVPTELHPQ